MRGFVIKTKEVQVIFHCQCGKKNAVANDDLSEFLCPNCGKEPSFINKKQS